MTSWPGEPCEDPIVASVNDAPGSTAMDIAQTLGIDRRDAVHLLHEHFGECLFQDDRYRWWPAGLGEESVRTETHEEPDSSRSSTSIDHRKLISYYLEAVIADSRDDVSVFASSRGSPQYVVVGQHPAANGSYAIPRDQYAAFANQAFKDGKRLSIGSPVFAQYITSKKGWSGFVLKPLFTWTIQPGVGQIDVVQSSIAVNADVVAGLSGQRRANPEEVVSLQTSLGLDRPEELPEFDEVMARLVSLHPGWPWAELMDPHSLGVSPQLGQLDSRDEEGLYNRVILAGVEGPTYTRGLETELAAIVDRAPKTLTGTALGYVVDRPHHRDTAPALDDSELIEPLPLNTEQRDAVKAALTRDFTVVTGPPGTGKSQVVSSIVVNAAYRGQSVLFASRNNKAVDVVEERVNGLSLRPGLLRLGRQHLDALAGYLASVLAMPAYQSIRDRHARSVSQLKEVDGRIRAIDAAVAGAVEARNAVAELDAKADDARLQLPPAIAKNPMSIDVDVARNELEQFRKVARRADRSSQTLAIRVLWFAVRSRREEALEELMPDIESLAESLGEANTRTPSERGAMTAFVSTLSDRLDQVKLLQEFDDASSALASSERVEELYRRRVDLVDERSAASLEVWSTWVGAIRAGISPGQQNDLGALNAVVKSLAAGNWSPTLSRKFQRLIASVKQFLPAWAITSLSVRGRIPLEPKLFDLVVIDEASQCDIASAIPLLYRAKRAVIIGDEKQLRHISGLTATADESIRAKHDMVGQVEWSYATESLYDLGTRVSDAVVFLRDHHRSDRDIIEFSNQEFYGGLLRVATRYDRLVRPEPPTAVRWEQVEGKFERPGGSGGINVPEAEAVVAELQRLEAQGYPGTIGVVTPFRAQANRIRQMAMSGISSSFFSSAEIDIGTAHTFQGDERDVMIYSPVITTGASRGALWFVGERNMNLFNVAITRARSALIVVGDRESSELQAIPTYRRFIEYVNGLSDGTSVADSDVLDLGGRYPDYLKGPMVSKWEHDLYEALHAAGIVTTPQVEIDAYRLDLALYRSDRKLDIEVDGERYHAAWDGDYVYADRLRNMRMLELGWDVMRFWVWEVRDDVDGCVDRVKRWIETS